MAKLTQRARSDDAAREWVELYNVGPESVELGDWTLSDSGGRSRGRIPGITPNPRLARVF